MPTWKPVSLACGCLLALACASLAAEPMKVDVFTAGAEGYHTYRIPALVVTNEGTLLAFCEGRKTASGDHGDIDLLLKRSEDGGRTWGPLQTVHEEGGKKKITIGNPCPVVDRKTGAIWMSLCRDNDQVLITHSTDDGRTWSTPRDITEAVKPEGATWYATGPVSGIQLRGGQHRGRLVMPCDHYRPGPKSLAADAVRPDGSNRHESPPSWFPKRGDQEQYSHCIYSDDGGRTWQASEPTEQYMNECAVAELSDGRLMLNMRSYRKRNQRAVAISDDGGQTWGPCIDQPQLIEPVCQGSLLRYELPTAAVSTAEEPLLLFCNPAATSRENLTVRVSRDDGAHWSDGQVLEPGKAAYSCLAVLADGGVACLYERGEKNAYEQITLARFELAWLLGGE